MNLNRVNAASFGAMTKGKFAKLQAKALEEAELGGLQKYLMAKGCNAVIGECFDGDVALRNRFGHDVVVLTTRPKKLFPISKSRPYSSYIYVIPDGESPLTTLVNTTLNIIRLNNVYNKMNPLYTESALQGKFQREVDMSNLIYNSHRRKK